MKVQEIWAEMARRKLMFHADEDWHTIKLWGLFNWGIVRRLLERGLLITDMRKENRTVWVRPSAEAYTKHIAPLLAKHSICELTRMAGWPESYCRKEFDYRA